MAVSYFSKVLVANRAEIAIRIARTLHDLGIGSVGVYGADDADAAHVRFMDEAIRLGDTLETSYLDPAALVAAAVESGCQAIHPGYGFLAENVELAQACASAGVTLIGPSPYAIEVMGDKIRSKNHVAAAGVPVVPGTTQSNLTDQQLVDAAESMNFPVLIKPSGGGGGKGMYRVESVDELSTQLTTARRVSLTAFGNSDVLLEQLIAQPRHIEVQILADQFGNVVHLGERECSLQRRHQKIIEEAPSVLISSETRDRIGQAAVDVARSVDYVGAGTVEFLVSATEPDVFYFMEMNTRLQVEHAITEQITGIDIVAEQIRLAAGQPLSMQQDEIGFCGHAIEARIYAEHPATGFLPTTGTVLVYREATGAGIRIDSGIVQDCVIGTQFDPMLAKIIATGADRRQALARLNQALADTKILGVHTNVEYLRHLLNDPDVQAGTMDTTLVESRLPHITFLRPTRLHADIVAHFIHQLSSDEAPGWQADGFRLGPAEPACYLVRDMKLPSEYWEVEHDHASELIPTTQQHHYRYQDAHGSKNVIMVLESTDAFGHRVWLSTPDYTGAFIVQDHSAQVLQQLQNIQAPTPGESPHVRAPIPGTVSAIHVVQGDQVSQGDLLITLEAMKMEHNLYAPGHGTVTLHVSEQEHVKLDHMLVTVMKESADSTP